MLWMKKDEVRYKDKMFDVKRVLHSGKQVVLIGHYDGFESKLFKLLFRYLGDDNDDADGAQKSPTWLAEAILTYTERLTFLSRFSVVYLYGDIADAVPSRATTPPYLPPDIVVVSKI